MTWPPSRPDFSLAHLESSRLQVHYPNPELPGSSGGLTRTKRPLSPSLIKVFLPQSGSVCSVHSGLSPWKGPQRTSSLTLSRSERENEASSVQTTLKRGGPGRGRAEGGLWGEQGRGDKRPAGSPLCCTQAGGGPGKGHLDSLPSYLPMEPSQACPILLRDTPADAELRTRFALRI